MAAAALVGAGRARAQDTIPAAAGVPPRDAAGRAPAVRVGADALGSPRPASPVLSSKSWVFEALRRLAALGLLDGAFDVGTPALTCDEAARLLGGAAASARARRPETLEVVNGYVAALAQETGECPAAGRPWGVAIEAGYDRFSGGVRAGVGYWPDWTGTRPLADTSTPVLRVPVTLMPSRYVSVMAVPELRSGGVRLDYGYATVALGPVAVWAGRRTFRFGPAAAGGIVISDAVAFNGGGLYLSQPIRLPWVLRVLGPIRMESFGSQVHGGDRIRDPYFIAFRGAMAPHPRLVLGLSRAAMFGGQGNLPVTLHNMTFLLVGGNQIGPAGSFANDMLALDLQYRPPLGPLPLTMFLEWGMDDGAGAWHHEPGFNAGVFLGSLPGIPWLGVGTEWTRFAAHYIQNTIWYRDFALRNGWTDDGIGVGSPLGGNGKQLLVYLDATAWGGRADLRASAFYRRRGIENLLAPERTGVSRGGSARLRLRPEAHLGIFADLDLERARGWTYSHLVTGLELRPLSTRALAKP